MSTNTCPECNAPLVFSPNGRARLCERCGYKEIIKKEWPAAAELAQTISYARLHKGHTENEESDNTSRSLLGQGISAAKAKNNDEAFYYFEWALRSNPTDEQEAQIWVWLSQIYDDLADKRICLEQAIALHPTNPLARRGLAILDGRLRVEEIVDPNAITIKNITEKEPRTIAPEQFQCPRCAARMSFTPDGQALTCHFCGYTHSLDEPENHIHADYGIGGAEQDFIAALATAKGHVQPVSSRTFQCQSCGVDFLLGPETLSLTCPYCDSVYVTEAAETGQLHPPQAVIPFRLNENDARQTVRRWLKQRRIDRARFSPFVGIYLPLWTFDLGGSINWHGYVEETKQDDPFFNTRGHTQRRKVSGSRAVFYDDILIPATKKLPRLLPELAATFSYEALVKYDGRYLADWPAERYQVTLAAASLQARKRVVQELRRKPANLTGGLAVQDLTINSGDLLVESFKLLLIPVWIVHYKVEDKVYHALINGQTGEIVGTRPRNVLGRLKSWMKGQ